MANNAKGKRPFYFDNPESDKLLAIAMALAAEVSVLHERLDTLERLVQAKGILSIEEIETYQPDERVVQERGKWRADYVARVLQIVQEQVESLS